MQILWITIDFPHKTFILKHMQLKDELTKHFRLTERQRNALAKLKIHTVEDLLYHIPARYEDIAESKQISDLETNTNATLYGQITDIEKRLSWKSKRYMVEATLKDSTGEITLMWFNQIYMEKMLAHKPFVKVVGKVTGKSKKTMVNPTTEILPSVPEYIDSAQGQLIPVYKESMGITSRWFYFAVKKALSSIPKSDFKDPIPPNLLKKYNLPTLYTSFAWAHFPNKHNQYQAAQKRFAFEEVFALQALKAIEKESMKHMRGVNISITKEAEEKLKSFVSKFGFPLTGAQKRAISDLIDDFKKPYPTARLLEGDVGSGKTAVAASASYLVYNSKTKDNEFKSLQTAYMAPTEILAGQLFEDFISFYKEENVKIALVTSSGCKIYPSKTQKGATKIACSQVKKWIKEGIVPIVIGTHSLIFKSVEFENLAFVIVDEQHRFGTNQRKALSKKDGATPHFLSMSATPIPRTLALTIYGDLELTLLDELPKGRKEIKTKIVSKKDRQKAYDFVKDQLKSGRQAYIICPRIEEPDPEKANALRLKSVMEEMEKLQAGEFKDYVLAPLHGKMKPAEKDETMKAFAEGKIDILVATSVVEVGVNVPNATVIIIEGAERFGLSQLHQLRGRVRRSTHEAYCFLFTDSSNPDTKARLKALEKSKDGFELAEADLKLRGAGDLYGSKQWGLSDTGMLALQNIKMVEAARKEATDLVKKDLDLKGNPILKEKISKMEKDLHLE